MTALGYCRSSQSRHNAAPVEGSRRLRGNGQQGGEVKSISRKNLSKICLAQSRSAKAKFAFGQKKILDLGQAGRPCVWRVSVWRDAGWRVVRACGGFVWGASARAAGASLNAVRGSRFVRVLGCAGASRPLVRVLRVLHVVLGVRRCLGARGKVK